MPDSHIDLSDVNLTAPAASDMRVAQMFERAARDWPGSPALHQNGQSISYGDLNAYANRLAARLRELGAGPGGLVAVGLDRSFEQVASVLAIMKSGAAFLPLDLAWPCERIATVLDRSGAEVVVGRAAPPAGPLCGLKSLLLDRDEAAIAAEAAHDQPNLATMDDLAYVIYTSGSTGTPKGVEITQGNLANFAAWHRDAFAIQPSDRSAHIAALGFDAAVWDVWPSLIAGASASLATDLVRTSAEELQRWMVADGITVAFVTTVLAEPMLAMAWPPQTALRLLLTGGDTLRARTPAGLPFRLLNNYGPTECTIIVTSGEVRPDEPVQPPPIGWPIAGSRIMILDEAGAALPPGEVGEITIGGPGVGRGYRNDRALTARQFIPDPQSDRPGARAYRTGDLGCVLPDGRIAFRGRVDQQVKIRGNRVELEEISRALSQCCLVSACCVVVRGPDDATRDLVAYVVPASGPAPTRLQLHAFLARTLPSYMLPAAYVLLHVMPITPNGKLDHRALPEANEGTSLGSEPSREPETPTEQRLAALVADLLGVERVSAEDNFFALGGHSLLGTQVILRAREAFEVELTLRHLFMAQTIALLAETIEQLIMEQIEALSEEDAASLVAS